MVDLWDVLLWIKKQFTKKDLLIIFLLIGLYLLTRLINLDQFPIFTDEGIYINWAKIAWKDATWRFISLTDGKQPLQTWATIPFLKLFEHNALFAGRLFSVTTGLATLIGIFSLLFYLFGKKAAYFGSLLYICTPFFLFYDRLALADSGVNAGFVWILFFSILLARTMRLDVALLFGMVSGAFLLVKSSVRLFLGLSVLAPILLFQGNFKKFIRACINYLFLYAILSVLAILVYNVQRLSPFLHFVSEKNKTFVFTFDEWVRDPFALFFPNLKTIAYYVFSESAYILPLLGLIGLYVLLKNDKRLGIYLGLWLILPYLAIAFFGRVIYPRYLIFFVTLFLLMASYFLSRLKNKKLLVGALLAFFLSVGYFNYTILFDYKNIPLPPPDRDQYIEGGASGFGIKEIVAYARVRSKEKPVIILAEGNFGMTGDVLNSSLVPGDRIFIKGYWPLKATDIRTNQKELEKSIVLVLYYHVENVPKPPIPLKFILRHHKPTGRNAFFLYELTPDDK